MKCFKHNDDEAVAICAYCGRALCRDCVPASMTTRMFCTEDCSAALALNESTMQLLLHKSEQSARASACYCYLCGGLSAGAAVAAWFMLPSPFLIYFTGACAVVLILSGIWYQRGARTPTPSKANRNGRQQVAGRSVSQ
jgi:hypothetical protein